MEKKKLKPLSSVVQICDCGKVDVYKDDEHNCIQSFHNQAAQEYYD